MDHPGTMQCSSGSGVDGVRTVECLRGRLLAERVASKAAKEEADLLAKRLEELERKLYDEIKTWNRAERRLSKAMKKLESLNILHAGLPVSDSSTGSLSPSNGFSGHRASELDQETNPNSSLIDQLGLSGRFGSEDGGGDTPTGGSSVGSCAPVNTQSDRCEEHQMNLQGIGVGDHDADRERQHVVASESSAKSEDCCNEEENKLALVLVDRQPDVKAEDEVKMEANGEASKLEEKLETESNVNVQAVLLALRQVKEHLQCTIEIRSEFLAKKEELYGH